MTTVVHLSDLHLLSGVPESDAILAALLAALAREREHRGGVDLVVVTGDVFDSGDVDPRTAAREWGALHRQIQSALKGPGGNATPTLLVPGNHDRRRMGLFGPHSSDLFNAVASQSGQELFVHGTRTPFLAANVPRAFHGQPLDLLAYDSTYLPSGYLSAGGMVRAEDILHAASQLDSAHADAPLLFALHHHLVPTPLTDVEPIESRRLGAVAKLALHRLLPRLVSHADREELTMTALGAGTALSTLHELGRAVLVLHGHKHVATARKLEGTRARHGDVVVISGGSAGCAQTWTASHGHDSHGHDAHGPGGSPEWGGARLWPSFNVLDLDEHSPLATLSVDQVSFGYKGRSAGSVVRRPLLEAEREGARWRLLPFDPEDRAPGRGEPLLSRNDARVMLTRSTHGAGRLDGRFDRHVERSSERRPRRYIETVEGCPAARSSTARSTPRRPRRSSSRCASPIATRCSAPRAARSMVAAPPSACRVGPSMRWASSIATPPRARGSSSPPTERSTRRASSPARPTSGPAKSGRSGWPTATASARWWRWSAARRARCCGFTGRSPRADAERYEGEASSGLTPGGGGRVSAPGTRPRRAPGPRAARPGS